MSPKSKKNSNARRKAKAPAKTKAIAKASGVGRSPRASAGSHGHTLAPRVARPLKSLMITGGAGFIGSAFVRWLLASPAFAGKLLVFDALTYAGNLANFEPVAGHERFTFVRGDIRDRALVERLCREHGIDTIVNFAAETHVDRSIHGPATFIDTNVGGTLTLLEVARSQGGIHFHQISTDEVFGSLGKNGAFKETTPYDPRSPYAASKAAADHLVRAWANTYGLSTTITYCCNNYGPYQFPEKLVPLMIMKCLAGEALPVYGDGKNVRDWLHVDDHAEAVWQVLQKGRAGEAYNVGANCEAENLELLGKLMATVAKQKGLALATLEQLITFVADRPGHDRRYAIDATKIRRELGWRPRVGLADGLDQTVAWYLGNGAWIEGIRSGAYRDWLELNYARRSAT